MRLTNVRRLRWRSGAQTTSPVLAVEGRISLPCAITALAELIRRIHG
jgi:hypothetical protein